MIPRWKFTDAWFREVVAALRNKGGHDLNMMERPDIGFSIQYSCLFNDGTFGQWVLDENEFPQPEMLVDKLVSSKKAIK